MIEKIPLGGDPIADVEIVKDKLNEVIETVNNLQNPAKVLGTRRWHDVSTDVRQKAMAKVRNARKLKVKHKK